MFISRYWSGQILALTIRPLKILVKKFMNCLVVVRLGNVLSKPCIVNFIFSKYVYKWVKDIFSIMIRVKIMGPIFFFFWILLSKSQSFGHAEIFQHNRFLWLDRFNCWTGVTWQEKRLKILPCSCVIINTACCKTYIFLPGQDSE